MTALKLTSVGTSTGTIIPKEMLTRLKVKKGDTKPPMPLAQALTRMAASARTFKLESVSNSDLAWVAVGAGAQAGL